MKRIAEEQEDQMLSYKCIDIHSPAASRCHFLLADCSMIVAQTIHKAFTRTRIDHAVETRALFNSLGTAEIMRRTIIHRFTRDTRGLHLRCVQIIASFVAALLHRQSAYCAQRAPAMNKQRGDARSATAQIFETTAHWKCALQAIGTK